MLKHWGSTLAIPEKEMLSVESIIKNLIVKYSGSNFWRFLSTLCLGGKTWLFFIDNYWGENDTNSDLWKWKGDEREILSGVFHFSEIQQKLGNHNY